MVKLNDRFEFSTTLDLSRFVVDGSQYSNESCGNQYVLHSVLVHSGSVYGGHYYAYIAPNPLQDNERWYKFDDDMVTVVSKKQAVDAHFGGMMTHTHTHTHSY